jgi:hypothetical protein
VSLDMKCTYSNRERKETTQQWEKSIIAPTDKKGDKRNFINYRDKSLSYYKIVYKILQNFKEYLFLQVRLDMW